MENRADTLTTIKQLEQQNAKQEQQIVELTAKLKWYEEQFRLAQQKHFGASSEKTSPDQLELNLFNEAEVLVTPRGQEPPCFIDRSSSSPVWVLHCPGKRWRTG
jgi:hypothetical protein